MPLVISSGTEILCADRTDTAWRLTAPIKAGLVTDGAQ